MSLSLGWEVISCPLLTIKVLHQPYLFWPECVLKRVWGGGSCKMWCTAFPVAAAVSSFASPLIKLIVRHAGFWRGGRGGTWITRFYFWSSSIASLQYWLSDVYNISFQSSQICQCSHSFCWFSYKSFFMLLQLLELHRTNHGQHG